MSQFDVGPGGALSPKTPATVPVGEKPEGIAVSPDGKNVYVANAGSDSLSQFNVGPGGVLSPKAIPSVATGGFPDGITISPDGRSVYVANFDTDSVSQYDVGPGGALSPKSPATVAAGVGPLGIAISASGRSVYAADREKTVKPGSVSQYTVGANGGLTPKATPAVRTGVAPWGVAVSPDGNSVYVASSREASQQGVWQYNVAADGSLSLRRDAGWPRPRSLVVAPDQAPVAAFTVNSSGAGSPSSFDASASAASDGRSVVRYEWDFGDGSHTETTGPKVTHTYAFPNTFTVTLTVTDDAGCSTRTVFTGHTAYCHGTSAARATRQASVLGRGHGLSKVGRARALGDLVRVPFSCVGRAACKLTLALTAVEKLKSGKVIGMAPARVAGGPSTRRVTVARSDVTLRPGKHVTIRLRLNRTGVRLLHRFHRFTATLQAPRSLTAIDNQQLTLD